MYQKLDPSTLKVGDKVGVGYPGSWSWRYQLWTVAKVDKVKVVVELTAKPEVTTMTFSARTLRELGERLGPVLP